MFGFSGVITPENPNIYDPPAPGVLAERGIDGKMGKVVRLEGASPRHEAAAVITASGADGRGDSVVITASGADGRATRQ